MYTIDGEIKNILEINKSQFITYLKHVESVEEAKSYIQKIKELHKDATHHVTGYIIGKGGENGHYDDNGEPSGTAGMPIFDVLRKNELTNIVIDVVRYFGGIKLGAGGLVRAYSKSCGEAIKNGKVIPIIEYQNIKLVFDYSYLKLVERNLDNIEILNKFYETNVTLIIRVPMNKIEEITTTIKNITQNTTNITFLDK